MIFKSSSTFRNFVGRTTLLSGKSDKTQKYLSYLPREDQRFGILPFCLCSLLFVKLNIFILFLDGFSMWTISKTPFSSRTYSCPPEVREIQETARKESSREQIMDLHKPFVWWITCTSFPSFNGKYLKSTSYIPLRTTPCLIQYSAHIGSTVPVTSTLTNLSYPPMFCINKTFQEHCMV